MTSALDDSSKLWFERLYARVGLPFWAGVLVVGFLPPLIMRLLGYYTYGVKTDFTGGVSLGVPLLIANVIYILFSSRYIRRHVERIALRLHALAPNDLSLGLSLINVCNLQSGTPLIAAEGLHGWSKIGSQAFRQYVSTSDNDLFLL